MCGRFYFQFKQDSVSLYLQDLVQKNHLVEFASDEIFPSQEVLVLLQNKDSYDIDVMKWGFDGYKGAIINARSETLHMKQMFCNIQGNRCLVPCNGFYEWSTNGHLKQKEFICKKKQSVIYMAAIYNERKEFVILTQESKGVLRRIHHRMPILVLDDEKDAYFNGQLDFENQEDNLCIESEEVKAPCFDQVKFEF